MVSMKLVTPGKGTLTLSREENPELFNLAKVGLGALGVVSEVTLQLGRAHHLMEHTYVTSGKVMSLQFTLCKRTFTPSCMCPVSTALI